MKTLGALAEAIVASVAMFVVFSLFNPTAPPWAANVVSLITLQIVYWKRVG